MKKNRVCKERSIISVVLLAAGVLLLAGGFLVTDKTSIWAQWCLGASGALTLMSSFIVFVARKNSNNVTIKI